MTHRSKKQTREYVRGLHSEGLLLFYKGAATAARAPPRCGTAPHRASALHARAWIEGCAHPARCRAHSGRGGGSTSICGPVTPTATCSTFTATAGAGAPAPGGSGSAAPAAAAAARGESSGGECHMPVVAWLRMWSSSWPKRWARSCSQGERERESGRNAGARLVEERGRRHGPRGVPGPAAEPTGRGGMVGMPGLVLAG